ncbi:HAD domain-containing protein [Streptomyces iconiensis]|uniref:HAD domain-containing protein n=1 Tax=Streptomyces iconiensis TaxID=1384038 RepID=A0ABT7ABS5_9ACTN|nr:HAD domain-containing protein [Streptomyces iconiensis]MDJ1138474.1 HAD domain-containing protein [Streptomyces iconiensis]
MRKPYLLLDIDGVLIPFPSADGTIPPSHTRHSVTPAGRSAPVDVWLDPAHGRMLNALVAEEIVDIHWCTSWRADASVLIGALLGLPCFPHLELPHPDITTSHPNGYLWKRDYVAEWLGAAPAIWIDDDFTDLDHDWAGRREQHGVPTLLVQPGPYRGLEADHLAAVREWIAFLTLAA